MEDTFRQFWWLIFPMFWFVAGGMRLWMRYRQQQAWLEVAKTYAAQGKDPPAEVSKALTSLDEAEAWRGIAPWRRRGPFSELRRAVLFTALAAGFFIAFFVTHGDGGARGLLIVAVIMTALAAAFGALAILSFYAARAGYSDERFDCDGP